MKVQYLIQFHLRTLQLAILGLGMMLGLLPHWLGPYDVLIKSVFGQPPQHRATWAATDFPAGNQRTREFFRWSATLHFAFCSGDLDANGDLVTLDVYPCWPTSDQELERIARVRSLRSLRLSAENVTDNGFVHLHNMPALKNVHFVETSGISDTAISHFRQRRPDVSLTFTLPDRR